MKEKLARLEALLRSQKRIAVAFSGGLDSSVLLAYIFSLLGKDGTLALHAQTPYMMQEESEEVRAFCQSKSIPLLFLALPLPASLLLNPPNRCYLCKKELFTTLKREAQEAHCSLLVDGSHLDDESDYRPGKKALQDLEISSPFKEAGFTKADIRTLGQELGLQEDLLQKPPYACLLTRLEHHSEVTEKRLKQVDLSEIYLRSLGFRACRVRAHGSLARLELEKAYWPSFFKENLAEQVQQKLQELGFDKVSLDLAGYQRGSMNPAELPLL